MTMTNDLKLSVFSTLQSYESKPLSLDTILWWIRQDQSVAEKTELYRSISGEGMAHDADAYYNPEAVAFTVSDAEAAEANLDPSTEPGKPRKVSLVMKNLGYRSQRNSQGCFYRVFEMKPDEQQAVLAADDKMEAADNQRDTTEQALPF